jgi:hypothetical protein
MSQATADGRMPNCRIKIKDYRFMNLTCKLLEVYSDLTAEKKAVRIGLLLPQGAKPSPIVGFFFAQHGTPMEGRVRGSYDPLVTCGQQSNLARSSTPIGLGMVDFKSIHKEHRMSSHAHNIAESTPNTQELIINIGHLNRYVEYLGTKSTLENEGVIPSHFNWPEGYSVSEWKSGEFSYHIYRTRPINAKGPRKDFIDCDWWVLRWSKTKQLNIAQEMIEIKAKDLANQIYRFSKKGQDEQGRLWNRYYEAIQDKKFQTFKTLIPGLVSKKRGRPSKVVSQ